MQIGRAHPGNVQGTQRDPSDEEEMGDEEETPSRSEADRGALAAPALTLHASKDARGGSGGSRRSWGSGRAS
ncbi:hypothetical protein GCM10010295_45210 [Streptomyces intermedius]